VTTPPPSSSTPPPSTNSRTTSGPPAGPGGVQAPDGYKTDTGAMSTAGRNINNRAEDAKGEVDEVQPAKVQAVEFGKLNDHQTHHTEYSNGIKQLGEGAVAMCDNLMSFAGQLGGVGSNYAATEGGATSTVSQPGASM
jgi:hypothetical protein